MLCYAVLCWLYTYCFLPHYLILVLIFILMLVLLHIAS